MVLGMLEQQANGLSKPVICSVCGTEGDPQVRSRQVEALRARGVCVAPSNARAAGAAADYVTHRTQV